MAAGGEVRFETMSCLLGSFTLEELFYAVSGSLLRDFLSPTSYVQRVFSLNNVVVERTRPRRTGDNLSDETVAANGVEMFYGRRRCVIGQMD